MAEQGMSADEVRRILGMALAESEATALVDWYAGLARQVERFPAGDLKGVEPPLRSTPGPKA